MNVNRASKPYLEGVNNFFAVAIEYHKQTGTMIRYPCVECNNARYPGHTSIISEHLIRWRFMVGYTTWT